jgi:hypothetical protein
MQATSIHADADRLFIQPKATQLSERDHTVLLRSDFSDAHVGPGDFPPHIEEVSRHTQ